MAIIGALFVTLLALVGIYFVGGFWFLYMGFADSRPSAKIAATIFVAAVIFGTCLGWWVLVGTHIHFSFG
jgi:hypothetical protein